MLAADLETGLRRLKLSAIRARAGELLVTMKRQPGTPEDFLRTLTDAESASWDASLTGHRTKAAGFPVVKTIAVLDLTVSSIPAGAFANLASLKGDHREGEHRLVGPWPPPKHLAERGHSPGLNWGPQSDH
jgi:hypothetical protein